MKLYMHYDETDTTIIMTVDDSASLNDVKQQFTKLYNEKHSNFKPLSADDLQIFSDEKFNKELSPKGSRTFRDKDDVFIKNKNSLNKEANNFQTSTSKEVSQNSSPFVSPPSSVSISQSTSKPTKEKSFNYPFEEVSNSKTPTGINKGMNWGKCSNCEVMVQFSPSSKKVKCVICNTINIPVVTATSQTECGKCGKMIYSVQGSPIIRCYDCGNQLLAITCTKCKIPFCYPRGIRYLPCPSNCGNVMEDDREDLEEITSGLEQKLISENINIISPEVSSTRPINLIVQYYVDQSPVRQLEIDQALQNNIENVYITQIHLMLENLQDEKIVREKFHQEKLKIIKLGKRLKYSDAFEYASQNLKGELCILSNSDIYFDHTLRYLFPVDMTSKIFALTRYDMKRDGSVLFNEWIAKLCQDSWIFESPIPLNDISVDFCLGQPGCDNRICYEFQLIGWRVLNACRKLITRHLHTSEKRNYVKEDTVQGKYSLAFPTDTLSMSETMHKLD